MKKYFGKFLLLFVGGILLTFIFANEVFAGEAQAIPERQRGFILPKTSYETMQECGMVMLYVNQNIKLAETAIKERQYVMVPDLGPAYDTDIMGCGIKTGDIKLWMVPFYVRFFLEFIIGLAGLLAVAGFVYGGYLYLFAGVSDEKDRGKHAIKNAVIGLILTLTAWAIVNIVITLVTL